MKLNTLIMISVCLRIGMRVVRASITQLQLSEIFATKSTQISYGQE